MPGDEYENVKKFYKTLKLKNLGELNKIYNFQDTIILCEIFEQYSCRLQEFLNTIPGNATQPIHLVVVYKGTKTSVVLRFQPMLNMRDYLKKH